VKTARQFNFLLGCLVLLLALSACGLKPASDHDIISTPIPAYNSQFIDSPVRGLYYQGHLGSSGVTQSNGRLICQEGEILRFRFGANIHLGSGTCADKIFLVNLDTAEHAAKIGALLQPFGDENQIEIPGALMFATLPPIDFATADNNVLADYLDRIFPGIPPVTIEEAQAHINRSLAMHVELPDSLRAALEKMRGSNHQATKFSPEKDVFLRFEGQAMSHCPARFESIALGLSVFKNTHNHQFYLHVYKAEDESYQTGLSDSLISAPRFSATARDDQLTYGLTLRVNSGSKKLVGQLTARFQDGDKEFCQWSLNEPIAGLIK
jgi:hypothetical protein